MFKENNNKMHLKHIASNQELGKWPDIQPEDIKAILDVLDSGILYSGKGGPNSDLLEEKWGDYCKVPSPNVVAVSACTAALHLAMITLGVGPGDEVITTAMTFSGTSHPICYTGATPIFVDVNPLTFNLDPESVRNAISKKTKAILPVHLHGLMADMPALQTIAAENNIFLIEDACQAHGATIRDKKAGTWGDVGCFSLSESKSLTGGQGGFIVFRDRTYADKARMLRNYGEDPSSGERRDYTSYDIGFNYVLSEIPAALAISQLNRLDKYNTQANRNAIYLSKLLSKISGLCPPFIPNGYFHIFHKYRLVFDPTVWFSKALSPSTSRDIILHYLQSKNVPVTTWQTMPVPEYPVFRNLESTPCPKAQYILDHSIIIGDERHPLAVQNKHTMLLWANIIGELFDKLSSIYSRK